MVHFGCSLSRRETTQGLILPLMPVCALARLTSLLRAKPTALRGLHMVQYFPLNPKHQFGCLSVSYLPRFFRIRQVRSDSTCSIDRGAEAVLQVCHWNSSGQKSFYWWLRFWLAIESAGWSQRSDGGQVHARDRWGLENWHLEKTWTAKKETSYEQMNEWTSVECLKFELWPNAHCRQKGAN